MPDIAEIERQIGTPPGDASLKITPRTKGLVQQWMIAQGLDPARVDASREKTIRRAYVDPHFLRTLKTRRDYCPSAGGCPQAEDGVPGNHWILQDKPAPAPTQPAPQPTVTAPTTDPMVAFATALHTIMPPGVPEERVLQLIYDHVPGLIRLAMAEMFGELATKLSNGDEEC